MCKFFVFIVFSHSNINLGQVKCTLIGNDLMLMRSGEKTDKKCGVKKQRMKKKSERKGFGNIDIF